MNICNALGVDSFGLKFEIPALKDWAMEWIIHYDAFKPVILFFLSESRLPAAGRRDSNNFPYFTSITFCVLIKSSAVILMRYIPLGNPVASQFIK